MIETLAAQLQALAQANPLSGIVVQFELGENSLFLDTRGDVPNVTTVDIGEPQTLMTLSTDDFAEMLSGRLDPVKAFMGGRMKIEGDMMIAMKLANSFKRQ